MPKNLGIVCLDGDVAPEVALTNAIRREASRRRISSVRGINFAWKGLLQEGFEEIADIVKDLTGRAHLDGDFLSPLQSVRYNAAPQGADDDLLKQNAGKIERTWSDLELDYLIMVGGVGGLTSFRAIANFLPEYYHKRIVLVPKSMNGDIGRINPTLGNEAIAGLSPIYNLGQSTAATVAAQEIKWAMSGCYNGQKIMVAQFLGDYCGWEVAAGQQGGALVVLPEMFVEKTIEEMFSLITQRTLQAYNYHEAVIVAVSEADPVTEEDRGELIEVYKSQRKRSTGEREKNKADRYKDMLEQRISDSEHSKIGVSKFDITYQVRWRPPTEFDIRVARLYGQAAIAYLLDSKRDGIAMPYLELDTLQYRDPQAMGADLKPEDIKFANIDHIVLQPVPSRYLKRDDHRSLVVGKPFERVLEHITYSKKYDTAAEVLLGAPPV